MLCKNCGKEISEEYNYCPYCGFPTGKNPSEYFVRIGSDLRRKGKMKESFEHCMNAAKMTNDPYIYKSAGELAFLIGDLQVSSELYEKSISLLPDFPDTLYDMGVLQFRAGKIKKAIEYFTKCLDINVQFSMAYYWLGHSYYHTGKLDKAIEYFHKFLEHSPESMIAHYHLGVVYHTKGEEEKAFSHFKVLEQSGAEYASLFFHMGNVLFKMHRIGESVKYLKKALSINPAEQRALNLLEKITQPPSL